MTLEKSETTRKSLSYTIYCRTGYWIFTLGGQNWTFLSWQKLGVVLENKMFENWNYPKNLTAKIVLLNVHESQSLKDSDDFCYVFFESLILGTFWGPGIMSSQNIIISLGVCSILAKNLTNFDPTR